MHPGLSWPGVRATRNAGATGGRIVLLVRCVLILPGKPAAAQLLAELLSHSTARRTLKHRSPLLLPCGLFFGKLAEVWACFCGHPGLSHSLSEALLTPTLLVYAAACLPCGCLPAVLYCPACLVPWTLTQKKQPPFLLPFSQSSPRSTVLLSCCFS